LRRHLLRYTVRDVWQAALHHHRLPLALPVIPLWALSSGPVLLAIGAFLMQFMVQGAWA